jgi:hypothetical protein
MTMVFSAMRAAKGVKANFGSDTLNSLSVARPVLVLAAGVVLAVMAVALIALVTVGG